MSIKYVVSSTGTYLYWIYLHVNLQLKLFLILVAVSNPCIVHVYNIELECVKHYIDTKYMYMYLPYAT